MIASSHLQCNMGVLIAACLEFDLNLNNNESYFLCHQTKDYHLVQSQDQSSDVI